MNALSVLLLLVVASACRAFVPQTTPPTSSTTSALKDTFDGKMFDPAQNPLSRGGKNSWEFEYDTMYVEEPKKKKVTATKVASPLKKGLFPVKKVTPVKKAVAAKNAPAKQGKNPFVSAFAKKQAAPVEPSKPTNPILSLFQK